MGEIPHNYRDQPNNLRSEVDRSLGSAMRKNLLTYLAAPKRKPGAVGRRQVISGEATSDTFYKSFVGGGGGEATLFVIAAVVAAVGGNKRNDLYDQVAEMQSSSSSSSSKLAPTVKLEASRLSGKVSLQIVAPVVTAPDFVDFIWLRDADSGDVFSARKFKASEPAPGTVLQVIVERGQKIVPVVHTASQELYVGDAFIAVAAA
jgi:hypothetical protein